MTQGGEIDLDKLIKRKGGFVYLAIAENLSKEKQKIEGSKEVLEELYATWLKLAEYEDIGLNPKELHRELLKHRANGVKNKWEKIINPYGELEGFICVCGHQSLSASNYCPNCGKKMNIT